MENFIRELKDTLEKLLSWSDDFRKGERNHNFNIDDELYLLSEKYNQDFKNGHLLLIYNLVDYYCDAVKHSFKEIDNDYSTKQAHEDIKELVDILKHGNNTDLEVSEDLEKRIKSI